jgi:heat shock transcription factor
MGFMQNGQAQYADAMQATAGNSLARRPMNIRVLVPASPGGYDPSQAWGNLPMDNGALTHQQHDDQGTEDSIEVLEEKAQQAKREAQAKRKQIPPFVQKLSR